MIEDVWYFLFFKKINKIGNATITRMVNFFGSIENAFNSDRQGFLKCGLPENIINEIFYEKRSFNIEQEKEIYNKLDINIISISDENYPVKLKKIQNPPSLLFYKGNLNNDAKTIAVVGSRDCSEYGKSVTNDFCKYFIDNNIVIVSGGAIGIDSESHKVAVCNNSRTISVMGTSANEIYPRENKHLFQDIINKGGVIISEFPIGYKPLSQNFVMRNRTIAGLSDAVLIVEAGIKSGTMTTAGFAIDQNKNVFVVPGSIYSKFSEGANYLIKNGAIFVTDPKEILEMTYGVVGEECKVVSEEIKTDWMSDEEKNVFENILYKPINIEDLVVKTSVQIQKLNSILIVFEIRGLIVNVGGMNYKRIK